MRRHLYRGRVIYVFEGDRFDVVMDMGFYVTSRICVRSQGFVTPSFRAPSSEGRLLARGAKDCAMDTLLDRWVWVETFKDEWRPSVWSANLYLDADTDQESTLVELEGKMVVDFAAYMKFLKGHKFDQTRIDLRHVKPKRAKKPFTTGKQTIARGFGTVEGRSIAAGV